MYRLLNADLVIDKFDSRVGSEVMSPSASSAALTILMPDTTDNESNAELNVMSYASTPLFSPIISV